MGVMDERSSRMFVGVCLLVLLWIGTYWVYDPGRGDREPTISFAEPDRGPDPAAEMPAAPVVAPPAPTSPVVSEPAPETPADPGLRVEPPLFREYIVRANDTYERIAQRELGSSSLAGAIARANPLKDPTRLQPGQPLRIPLDPDNIQGRVVTAGGGEPVEPPKPQTPTAVEYRVQPGDTLTGIARSYYGSIRHADFIFASNRDVLAGPDSLRVGQVLRLPPLPPGDGG
jgi:nucleoid-associated protein YgaU